MDKIQRTHFIGDTHNYKLTINTKYKQARLEIPIKRAEDKTIDAYTIDSTKRYKSITVFFTVTEIVPIEYFEFTYVYSLRNWCVDCNLDFNNIKEIRVNMT